ncbi:Hypothetical predicted protein [Pelobates cultripes]|uniref:Uncharacterized protein n=1 Tax=Pelobates cultripes TaxID=61616 RepID=A0AAD1R2J3_PELCU|nr:Hypothetical predicted protein [Pelobates cultripes]
MALEHGAEKHVRPTLTSWAVFDKICEAFWERLKLRANHARKLTATDPMRSSTSTKLPRGPKRLHQSGGGKDQQYPQKAAQTPGRPGVMSVRDVGADSSLTLTPWR